jgi:hypothetical protein
MDKGSLEELLDFILESIGYIKKRFLGINAADDFLENDTNMTKLDAIAMRLLGYWGNNKTHIQKG